MVGNDPSDRDLLKAHGRGDPDAFEVLYGRNKGAVFALCMRFGRDREEALDLLQEAFLYLSRIAPKQELRHRVVTLLYPVIKRGARDRRRRVVPIQLEEVPEPWAPADLPEDLAGLLRGLKDEHQEVLLLFYRDGLSVAEIAAALEIPEGTAKSRLFGARDALRRKLREKPEES